MFDKNQFKKSVKDWLKYHPDATVEDLEDYCEQLIPSQSYTTNFWLINQTVSWYQHILSSRELSYDELFEIEPKEVIRA